MNIVSTLEKLHWMKLPAVAFDRITREHRACSICCNVVYMEEIWYFDDTALHAIEAR